MLNMKHYFKQPFCYGLLQTCYTNLRRMVRLRKFAAPNHKWKRNGNNMILRKGEIL